MTGKAPQFQSFALKRHSIRFYCTTHLDVHLKLQQQQQGQHRHSNHPYRADTPHRMLDLSYRKTTGSIPFKANS